MGMFDTFHIQDHGRHLAIQTWIEDHKEDWIDPACPTEWIALLLVDGCFLDAFVARDEAEARNAAEIMARLWQSPERQAEAFQRHARAHYQALTARIRALDRVSRLLHDYVEWQEREAKGEADTSLFRFMRHDFGKESWDWAIARLLLELPEYREHVPGCYAVGAELEAVNPGRGENHE